MTDPNQTQPSETIGPPSPGDAVDLRAIWRVFRKRWQVAVVVMVAVTGSTFLWTKRQPKIYQASCSMVIDTMAPQVLQNVKDVVELGSGTYWADQAFFETQFRIISSKMMAQLVVDRLKLENDPDYPEPGAGPGAGRDLAASVMGSLSVGAVKESRVVQVTVSDRNPERAAVIANAYADAYLEYNIEHRRSGAREATDWLSQHDPEEKNKLTKSHRALYEFKKEKNLLSVSLEDKQNMTSQNLQQLNTKISDVRAKRLEMESTRRQIVAARTAIADKEVLPQIRDNGVIAKLRSDYFDATRTLAELRTEKGANHPRTQEVERKLEVVQHAYEKEIDDQLRSFDKAYEAVADTEKSLNAWMEREKKEAIELAKLEIEYTPLVAEYERNKRMDDVTSQREKEIGLTSQMKSNNVRILDRAVPVHSPVSPRLMFNLMAALLAGALLGLVLTFALEVLDNTLKTQDDVERLLGIPVLGPVPLIPAAAPPSDELDALRARDLGTFRSPKSPAAEFYRALRTNLLFMSPDKPIRTLLVTSPGPQEGKTTTAINLAVTMAQANTRVLIIDTDMRRPRLHRSFGVPNETGVTTVVMGETTLDAAIKRTEVPNVDVLTCGPVPPNPAELLHTEKFQQMLDECRRRYDRVILDSPPTSAVTDASVIGNRADGVVLVIRAARTRRETAIYARRQLMSAKARLLGVVMNEVDFSNRSYGYNYYYYRTYGRYYGTAAEGKKA